MDIQHACIKNDNLEFRTHQYIVINRKSQNNSKYDNHSEKATANF